MPSTYANDLVEIASSHLHEPAPAMAKRPMISERITALLDQRQRRSSLRKRSVIAMSMTVLIVMSLLSAISLASPDPQDSSKESSNEIGDTDAEAAILAANKAFIDAFDDGDAEAMATRFSEDAEVYPPFGRSVRGRRAIARHYDDLLDQGYLYEITSQTEDLEVTGDTAYETGRYAGYSYSGERITSGSYMAVWKNENGVWRVYREMISVRSQSPVSTYKHWSSVEDRKRS